MPKSRGNNEGSIYQDKRGRRVVQVTVAGTRVSRIAKDRDNALRKLAELQVQENRGTLTLPTNLTLDQWVEQWLALVEPDLRPSALAMYRRTLNYVRRILGTKQLDKLPPLLLTQAFARLQRESNAQRQLALAHGYLSACLQRAVDLEVIATNPMLQVAKPKWEPVKRRYWTLEETRRFVEAGLRSPARWNPLLVFLVTTGLRFSEAMELTWADVVWQRRQVRVERALVWVGKESHLVPPKTKAGRRVVSLPEPALEALRRLQPETAPGDAVFRTQLGNVPRPAGAPRDSLRRLCDQAGIPFLNVHGLRHVAATMALQATGDEHAVQRRLGHSHVSVTLTLYAFDRHSDDQIAERLAGLLTGEQ